MAMDSVKRPRGRPKGLRRIDGKWVMSSDPNVSNLKEECSEDANENFKKNEKRGIQVGNNDNVRNNRGRKLVNKNASSSFSRYKYDAHFDGDIESAHSSNTEDDISPSDEELDAIEQEETDEYYRIHNTKKNSNSKNKSNSVEAKYKLSEVQSIFNTKNNDNKPSALFAPVSSISNLGGVITTFNLVFQSSDTEILKWIDNLHVMLRNRSLQGGAIPFTPVTPLGTTTPIVNEAPPVTISHSDAYENYEDLDSDDGDYDDSQVDESKTCRDVYSSNKIYDDTMTEYYDSVFGRSLESELNRTKDVNDVYYPGTTLAKDDYESLSDGGYRKYRHNLSDDIDSNDDYM